MSRRALAAVAASAVVLAGLTVGAVPANAGITEASLRPSTWIGGSSPSAIVQWTEGDTLAPNDFFSIEIEWDWSFEFAAADSGNATFSGTTFTCPGIPAITFQSSGFGGANNNSTAKCTFINGGPGQEKRVTLEPQTAGGTIDFTNATVVATFPADVITASTTPRSNYRWTLCSVSCGAGDFEYLYASVPAVDSAGNPIPVITLNIDANEGQCATESVRGLQGSWTTAPGADNCSKFGARFIGYNTERNGSGIAIAPGGNLNLTFDNTLYAIYETPRPAAAPTDVVAVAGRNKITVSWKAPTDPGTYAITNYLAQATPSGRVCVTRTSDANMLSCTFDLGATNTKYSFKVQALNGAGWGPVSAESAAVSPYNFREVSGSRANVLLGLAGTKVETYGAAPGLAGLAVTPEYKVGGAANWTSVANAAKVSADGKFSWSKRFPASANKQNVTVRFTYGGDAVSDTLVLSRGGSAGSLSAPRNVKVENVVNRVIVTWDPPKFDGGEKITGYTMCATSGSSLCQNVPADGRGVFQNLATGREYTITVAARTAKGEGPKAEAKQKVSPVEAFVGITSRVGERIEVRSQANGFKNGAKFRLEFAVTVPGEPASSWSWVAFPNIIADGNVNRGFLLPSTSVKQTIAVRLVTPNGPAYSRPSRPPR